ncbi:tetratricopeptide repeat protein, partial [Anaplasma marginale]|uniref:tetratricopeptide repeat protein n=1 Tax=Anaplasma marginale TaxID=770 RepID=UPI0005B41C72
QLILVRKIGSKAQEQQVSIELGKAYLALQDYVGVIDTYEQIINFSNLPSDRQQAIVLGTLGNAYLALGNNQRAIEYLKPYLEITEKINDVHGQKIALNHLGLALYNTGNLVEAEKLLRQRIALEEKVQESVKFSEFEKQALPYDTLQKTLIAENKPEEALLVAERARKSDLLDLLGRNNFPIRKEKLSLDEIKTIAKTSKATLVVYSLPSPTQLYIWVIEPTGEITFSQVGINPIDNNKNSSPLPELIDRSLAEIAVNSSEEEKQENSETTFQEIYQILIEPIRDILPQNPEEKIIFIPQKELFSIPFSALKDSKGKYL